MVLLFKFSRKAYNRQFNGLHCDILPHIVCLQLCALKYSLRDN